MDEDILSNATLNMDGKRIINVAYPRNPVENSTYNGDVVTAKALSDLRKYLLDEVLLRNSDNVMGGRLEMSGHKIKGLGNPIDSGDAVNKEYITARLKAVTDELDSILERINKLEIHKMKQPTAPIYPELPSEDGQNYRLQKISEIEKQLIREKNMRKALYKKYNRAIILTDSIDTTLISACVIMAGIGDATFRDCCYCLWVHGCLRETGET